MESLTKWILFVNSLALLSVILSFTEIVVARTTFSSVNESCPGYLEWLYHSGVTTMVITIPMIVFYNVLHWVICDEGGGEVDQVDKDNFHSDRLLQWSLFIPLIILYGFSLIEAASILYHGLVLMIPCHRTNTNTDLGFVRSSFIILTFVITAIRTIYLLYKTIINE